MNYEQLYTAWIIIINKIVLIYKNTNVNYFIASVILITA